MPDIVKPRGPNNYMNNRMGIPAYDNMQFTYVDLLLTTTTYFLDGVTVAQVAYTYDVNDDLIDVQRIL
tara:strand:+ start:70 stop:273 length:204 start_codon:yes stop_codon:yes gene_type:complete